MSWVCAYYAWGNTNFYGISLTSCFTKWNEELNSIFKKAETNWRTWTKLFIKVTAMVLSQSLKFRNDMRSTTINIVLLAPCKQTLEKQTEVIRQQMKS